ncbi:MAG: geranylgeranylglycerol-phosphate geranylgeranyltransferase [Chitinophagales bacterium]|nr:geranylgeranylglycerol-phosphate geranylgeranyltransferase [Chitinophagales bacterium]
MKLLKAFSQLIRLPNLIFVIITQILFFYCIQLPLFKNAQLTSNIQIPQLFLIIILSICIAAAGNIINDYFDYDIDVINKPNKVVVQRIISKKWILFWYALLNIIGIALSFIIEATTQIQFLAFANILAIIILFFYSAYFKKKFLVGNILISILTAWTILIFSFCEINFFNFTFINNKTAIDTFFKLSFLYAGFAFIISLIREIIKDLEDMTGDEKYGCKTMPIVLGVSSTKNFVMILLVILLAILVVVQYFLLHTEIRFWLSLIYYILFVIAPLVFIIIKLPQGNTPQAFHRLSTVVKIVMLTGIFTMFFFN